MKKLLGACTLLILVLVALALAAGDPARSAPSTPSSQQPARIEPGLQAALESQGQADLFVHFESVDLSAAYAMPWAERGEYVYRTLQRSAERSQAAAQALLRQARTLTGVAVVVKSGRNTAHRLEDKTTARANSGGIPGARRGDS